MRVLIVSTKFSRVLIFAAFADQSDFISYMKLCDTCTTE